VSARPRLAVLLAVLVSLAILPAAASASPPLNDDYDSPISIAPGDVLSANNVDATAQTGEQAPTGLSVADGCNNIGDGPDCATSVWYRFVAPASGNYTIDTCDLGTEIDTVVAIWSGASIGSASQVAVDDDDLDCAGGGGDVGSRVQFTATGGDTYHVELTGKFADQGSFYVRAYPSASPPAGGAPDTQIGPHHSFAAQQVGLQFRTYVSSGPRSTPSFDFYPDVAHAGATFQCSLDGAAFAACSSPVSYDGLSGNHTFSVRAVDGGNVDPTPAVQRFRVDNDPPDSLFTTPPVALTGDPNVTWHLGSSERNAQYWSHCSIDLQPQNTLCTDPSVDGGPFCDDTHEFRFATIDRAFNIDPTPRVSSFEETGGGACGGPSLDLVHPEDVITTATEAAFDVPAHPNGWAGKVHVQYGPTTAYGQSFDLPVGAANHSVHVQIQLLKPGTQYHAIATLSTPSGVVSTPDLPFTTNSAGTLPEIGIGTPVAVGNHAAAIPLTIDTHGLNNVFYGVQIDSGPLTLTSPAIGGDDVLGAGAGPVSRTLDITDLQPGTYHVRGIATRQGNSVTSPTEVTLTVPAVPTSGGSPPVIPGPEPPATPRFVLKRSAVKLGKLTRHSRFVSLTINGLPAGSDVTADVSASVKTSALKRLARGHAKANSKGIAKLKVKLSAKARKALRNRRVKTLSVRITIKPKGQPATHLTLRPKLKR
jgi:hypothetical protein